MKTELRWDKKKKKKNKHVRGQACYKSPEPFSMTSLWKLQEGSWMTGIAGTWAGFRKGEQAALLYPRDRLYYLTFYLQAPTQNHTQRLSVSLWFASCRVQVLARVYWGGNTSRAVGDSKPSGHWCMWATRGGYSYATTAPKGELLWLRKNT